MASSGALATLVKPLEYASARGFADLRAVKGLRTVLEGALARARGELIDAQLLEALEAELSHIDADDDAERRASIIRLGAMLKRVGVQTLVPLGFDVPQAEAPSPRS